MSLFIYLGYFWLTVGIFNERASYSLLKWCTTNIRNICHGIVEKYGDVKHVIKITCVVE
jgi:hypothetical protein